MTQPRSLLDSLVPGATLALLCAWLCERAWPGPPGPGVRARSGLVDYEGSMAICRAGPSESTLTGVKICYPLEIHWPGEQLGRVSTRPASTG